MSSTTLHTPTPWRVSMDTVSSATTGRMIADCERTPHCDRPAPVNPEDAANARIIVRAVNHFEALVEFARSIATVYEAEQRAPVNLLPEGRTWITITHTHGQAARALLAKVEG